MNSDNDRIDGIDPAMPNMLMQDVISVRLAIANAVF
jgi:hypothetical protein